MTGIRLVSSIVVSALLSCGSPASPPAEDTIPVAGSAVGGPVFSGDPCNMDEDCAPVAQCHPDRCAGVDHAGIMPMDLICTMECRPETVDCGFNHCGCVPAPTGQKVCALLPGPKPQ